MRNNMPCTVRAAVSFSRLSKSPRRPPAPTPGGRERRRDDSVESDASASRIDGSVRNMGGYVQTGR